MALPESNGTQPPATTTSLASDKATGPFLAPSFDPADFLNATLPTWTSSTPQRNTSDAVSLQDLNSQTQTLLAQLNTQLTRLSNTLTKLTDEILRSGNRLTYEVEVLRGDTTSLSDVLTQGLKEDIAKFIPGGLSFEQEDRRRSRNFSVSSVALKSPVTPQTPSLARFPSATATQDATAAQVRQLQTLSLVRNRLDSVIQLFGRATEWVLPPSELSTFKSSFISVSAPNQASNDAESEELEAKGRAYADKVRSDISGLISQGEGGSSPFDEEGAKKAMQRVEELRELAGVWKGTSEEKARLKFVDGLVKFIEDGKEPKKKEIGYGLRLEPPSRPGTGRR